MHEGLLSVAQKAGLNKAILDQGWFELRRQLEYKMAWRGGFTVAVPAAYTSQTCPKILGGCGHVSKENRKTQALFKCVSCGLAANADHVGALNILARGLELFEGPDLARIVCEVSGAVIPPATETRRSDCSTHRVAPKESPAFNAGEDVNSTWNVTVLSA